jgi:hypothetical protein
MIITIFREINQFPKIHRRGNRYFTHKHTA